MPTSKEDCMNRAVRDIWNPLDEAHCIEKVIYNPPYTTVNWIDGNNTTVKCCEEDEFDPKLGLLLCVAKKFLGTYRYSHELKHRLFPSPENHILFWTMLKNEGDSDDL